MSFAEDILDGLACQFCGSYIDDFESVGHPRSCENCEVEIKNDKRKHSKKISRSS